MSPAEQIQEHQIEDLNVQGILFDPEGPQIIKCEHCGRSVQYIVDHSCWGTCVENAEANHNEKDYH